MQRDQSAANMRTGARAIAVKRGTEGSDGCTQSYVNLARKHGVTQEEIESGGDRVRRAGGIRFRVGHSLLQSSMWGMGARAIIAAVVCLVLGMGVARPAFASTKPPTDYSFYVTTTDTSTAFTLGCNQGTYDASFSPVADSTVVLDFGGQQANGSGTKLVNGTLVTNAQIEAIAENFSEGYYGCTGSDTTSTLFLGIGTNNSYYDVSSSGGNAWAQVVSAVRSYNQTNQYDAQVSAGGADDMEPSYSTASATEDWANGYAGVDPAYYLDYGSADGCPQNSSTNGSCANNWTQYDVWYVSWGATPAQALPEIYNQGQSQEWAMISQYGANSQANSFGAILFEGPLDENDLDGSTYTSSQAWNQFTSDLTNAGVPSDMSFSAEIHHET